MTRSYCHVFGKVTIATVEAVGVMGLVGGGGGCVSKLKLSAPASAAVFQTAANLTRESGFSQREMRKK